MWQSPTSSGICTGSLPLLHKSPTGSSTETVSESQLPARGSDRAARWPRHRRHARRRLGAGHRMPPDAGPRRPLARSRWRAWRPFPRSVTSCRRGTFVGPAPAGRMTKVTHERHNSRRARAGRRADRTLQHGAGPGPGPQSVVGGRTGHRGGQVAGHGTASADDPERKPRRTAAAHQRGGLMRVDVVGGRPGKRPWIPNPLSRAILHSRTSRSSWSIASRRALVGCRFHRRRLLPGRISWRSR